MFANDIEIFVKTINKFYLSIIKIILKYGKIN